MLIAVVHDICHVLCCYPWRCLLFSMSSIMFCSVISHVVCFCRCHMSFYVVIHVICHVVSCCSCQPSCSVLLIMSFIMLCVTVHDIVMLCNFVHVIHYVLCWCPGHLSCRCLCHPLCSVLISSFWWFSNNAFLCSPNGLYVFLWLWYCWGPPIVILIIICTQPYCLFHQVNNACTTFLYLSKNVFF